MKAEFEITFLGTERNDEDSCPAEPDRRMGILQIETKSF